MLCESQCMSEVLPFSADQDRYYNASFLITNVEYNSQYERQTTEEFRRLSQDIETMVR